MTDAGRSGGEGIDGSNPTPPTLLNGRFAGPAAFSELVRHALVVAAAEGWAEICISDPHFADWPLGERSVAQSLHDWARAGRKFTMIAATYDEIYRRHARFVAWRKTWSHLIDCRVVAKAMGGDMPSALWSPGWVFHRLDLQRSTGVAGVEAARRVVLKERLGELLLKSAPGFPATTLGL